MSRSEGLWIPGRGEALMEAGEYPAPSQAELLEMWRGYVDDSSVVEVPGLLGTAKVVDGETVNGLASIDLCEVLRETHLGLRSIERPNEKYEGDMHAYAAGLSFANSGDIEFLARIMMSNDLIAPIAGSEKMASIMRGWRELGAYVVANTSTLPGCEPGTINFLQEYFKDCFDALLLPRNHDGTSPMTKGRAAVNLIDELSVATDGLTAVHIDDTPHHNVGFRKALAPRGARVATFQPKYETHYSSDPDSVITATPLAAFEAADLVFRREVI